MIEIQLVVGGISNTYPFSDSQYPAMTVTFVQGREAVIAAKLMTRGMQTIGQRLQDATVLKATASFETCYQFL